MTDTAAASFRKDRIERLLYELRYEITRGMSEREIEEELSFRFIVPMSKHFQHGVVLCEFRSKPAPSIEALGFVGEYQPKLTVVEGGKR